MAKEMLSILEQCESGSLEATQSSILSPLLIVIACLSLLTIAAFSLEEVSFYIEVICLSALVFFVVFLLFVHTYFTFWKKSTDELRSGKYILEKTS